MHVAAEFTLDVCVMEQGVEGVKPDGKLSVSLAVVSRPWTGWIARAIEVAVCTIEVAGVMLVRRREPAEA